MSLLWLAPFAGTDAGDLRVGASVLRDGAHLRLGWRISGRAVDEGLRLPPREASARRDELWRSTCLEAFVAPVSSEAYVEVNVAPSGAWNVYRFGRYREGMAPADPAGLVVLDEERGAGSYAVGATLELPSDFGRGPLAVGLTAVIDAPSGISYWALAHADARPDFHRREGFVLRR